ncbi:MAG: glucose 1-dehydrogenase [Rhodothermales bacterium]|nr:glucose 1-dehydrogenase [Rhodothermales bacterium]
MERFRDRTAVITGGSKGIGAAIVHRLHAEGARVAVLDVDPAGNVLETGDRLRFFACDVSRSADVAAAVEAAIDAFGDIDILVNNAGIQHYGTVVSTTEEEWDRVMAVNLKSAFLCARAVIPGMQRRGAGVVINMSSVQAYHSQANVAPYTTSKTAMLGLTRSIAIDFSPTIRCVAVCPGTVDTPMVRWTAEQSGDPDALYEEVRQMHLAGRIGTADEIAGLVAYLCSDEATFITGQSVRIDGGLGVELGGTVRATR